MHSTPHLVTDTFPPSQVGPGGGATLYVYIDIWFNQFNSTKLPTQPYEIPSKGNLAMVFWGCTEGT